ncbi:uncharacterized protein LOC103309288 [Acyrthosiphon pisum]|uniref:Uncharacterized protein n=1 Tax=Acyrthosiphon pisum TaxID=7029 RepID=A0A8R2JTY2_ACYPI|nr:uncharacterized protein LOC103309288 [Acyrthosiphon pisum]|eukprot:XP_016659413.1 PREDICTED: uncharacterized protein LOC103309288 isoform X2 [Acyrthosiphon pisum]
MAEKSGHVKVAEDPFCGVGGNVIQLTRRFDDEENSNNMPAEAEISSPSAEQLTMQKVFADLRNWSADFEKLNCSGDFVGLKAKRRSTSMPNISSTRLVDVILAQDGIFCRGQSPQVEAVPNDEQSIIQHADHLILAQGGDCRDELPQVEVVPDDEQSIQNTVQPDHPRTPTEEQSTGELSKKRKRPSMWKRTKRFFVYLFTCG